MSGMKIAYVVLYLRNNLLLSGVGRKITSQVSTWKEIGNNVQLFIVSPEEISLPNVISFQYNLGKYNRNFNNILGTSRSHAIKRLLGKVKEFNPDIIYLRYGLFNYPLHEIFNISPVVIEVNTNDVAEYYTQGFVHGLYNQLTRGLLFNKASGIVCVTNDIAVLKVIKPFNKPIKVLRNGIDLNKFKELPGLPNNYVNCAFIGITGIWQGIDKLLYFAKTYPELHFDIVGEIPAYFQTSGFDNIRFHGFLDEIRIRQVYMNSRISFGPLALHRKKMNEASALKVMESLAYGIPVVLGYKETELSDYNFDFILQIANNEDNIKDYAEEIFNFYHRMKGRRVDRNMISPIIDLHVIEKKRIDFLELF